MSALITSRLRKRFVKSGRCGNVSDGVLEMACLLPEGHRGRHASELIAKYGRVQSVWPQKATAVPALAHIRAAAAAGKAEGRG